MHLNRLVPWILLVALCVAMAGYGGKKVYRKWREHRTEKALSEWRTSETDKSWISTPFEQRYRSFDNPAALHYLNTKRNRSIRAVAGQVSPEVWNAVLDLYSDWPLGLRTFAEEHVMAVFMVKDLQASGYVITPDDEHFIIIIDEQTLGVGPNDWFSNKEQTLLGDGADDITLDHRLEPETHNLPEYTMENIILHELAHCIGVEQGITRTFTNQLRTREGQDFFGGAFHVPSVTFSRDEQWTEAFGQLRYYTGTTQLNVQEYTSRISALADSPFPTLYSTVSDLEYFAEYLYAYVHCVVQQRPITYRVLQNGETILEAKCAIDQPHHAKRRAMIERLLTDLCHNETEPRADEE